MDYDCFSGTDFIYSFTVICEEEFCFNCKNVMSDIVKLLPDSVANQIAAGEVVQRPASVVKELLENAVDAGATEIYLLVKDAGKTLIQVIDNGCGMSETDARMCFERHATSKISKASDLFSIRTLGFRGEAMASIAAVAQVELRTKREQDELATELILEASSVKSQQPCSSPVGTSISVKNLFFNVPARRKFLKSENVELRHIIDEFTRVAMIHPKIRMDMTHNGRQVFSLPKTTLKERIVNLLGNNLSLRLLPIDTETEYVSISGYIVKPEFAKKNRGEQFFFVNHRFIRSPFLHHAVEKACQQLLPENGIPGYFIFFELDPQDIDINIHPTKTEIKFTEEQMVYQFLMAAVKRSIGQFNDTPSIEFDNPIAINLIPTRNTPPSAAPAIKTNPNYNPFDTTFDKHIRRETLTADKKEPDYSDKLFGKNEETSVFDQIKQEVFPNISEEIAFQDDSDTSFSGVIKIGHQFMVTAYQSDLLLVDVQRALERIFFERNLQKLKHQNNECQKLLFPKTLDFDLSEQLAIKELLPELKKIGFDIASFGARTLIIHGVPSGFPSDFDAEEAIREMIADFDTGTANNILKFQDSIALTLARKMAAQQKTKQPQQAMKQLLEELFTTSAPNVTPNGKPIFKMFAFDDLDQLLNG